MRLFFPLAACLLFAGCIQTPELTLVKIDEAAAYPSQEPGTRPPVLTDFQPLTKEQLDEGWIRLFDGVSTYGWKITEGPGELAVKMQDGKPVLCVENNGGKKFKATHGFFNKAPVLLIHGGSQHGDTNFLPEISVGPKPGNQKDPNLTICGEAVLIRSNNMKALNETAWKPAAGDSKAVWTDGVLELTGGSGYVESVAEYGDFVLQLEYYTEAGINSGVFFRCIPGEKMNGYECQIFNNPPAEDYTKFIGTDTGGIFRRVVGRNVGPKDGQWNHLTIAARGPQIATWVNGIQTVDWTDARKEDENPRKGLRLKPGTIQLQGHDPGTHIKFRNFRISTSD